MAPKHPRRESHWRYIHTARAAIGYGLLTFESGVCLGP